MPRAGSYCSHVRPRQDLSSCSQSEEDDEPRAERTSQGLFPRSPSTAPNRTHLRPFLRFIVGRRRRFPRRTDRILTRQSFSVSLFAIFLACASARPVLLFAVGGRRRTPRRTDRILTLADAEQGRKAAPAIFCELCDGQTAYYVVRATLRLDPAQTTLLSLSLSLGQGLFPRSPPEADSGPRAE